jgi:hypothetical protein
VREGEGELQLGRDIRDLGVTASEAGGGNDSTAESGGEHLGGSRERRKIGRKGGRRTRRRARTRKSTGARKA